MSNKQPKLIYIIPNFGIGGAEVALLSAIPALNKAFDFKLVCLNKYNSSFVARLSEDERRNIVTFHRFPFNYIRALIFTLRFKPDILVSSLWKASILGVLAKLFRHKIKYVEFIHSSVYFHFLDKLFTKLAIAVSNVVFCDSSSAKMFIKEQYNNKHIEVISFLRFSSPNEWHPKVNIRLKALYIGRFHECKRIDKLIFLIKKLSDAGLFFDVDLFGRDDGTMSLAQEKIAQYALEDYVFLKGGVSADEVENLFSKYDFYFQTSAVEGMAMSVVEAMQYGLICVLTNVGEIRNYAKNGENAVIIDENFDLTDTVEQIRKITENIDMANAISKNACMQFASADSFADSLVGHLYKL
jgi:glycosyltransferase involved in cell wall biosynthesis